MLYPDKHKGFSPTLSHIMELTLVPMLATFLVKSYFKNSFVYEPKNVCYFFSKSDMAGENNEETKAFNLFLHHDDIFYVFAIVVNFWNLFLNF